MKSDLMIAQSSKIQELEVKNILLANKVKYICFGIILLFNDIIFIMGIQVYSAKKQGYEEAIIDMHNKTLKAEYMNGEVIWK